MILYNRLVEKLRESFILCMIMNRLNSFITSIRKMIKYLKTLLRCKINKKMNNYFNNKNNKTKQ